MLTLLVNALIKDRDNYSSPKVREKYGMLCGSVGIMLNVLLFAGKFAAGLVSGSIAVTADAINNLSDAGSSVMTMLGFKLAGKKPDPGHPFGHGRMEYVSGLMVAVFILIMAIELIKSSIEKIITPEPVDSAWWIIVLLAVSIAVKMYMNLYNRKYGKLIGSSAMKATAADSLNDCIATGGVLFATLISRFTGLNLDAYCGLLVGLFILYSGIKTALETVGDLMGKAPEPEFVEHIQSLVLSHKEVLGVHDLIVHDYGPGRMMVSLHAEVPASGNMLELHDIIDNIENELRKTLGCAATIHMDPVSDDEETVELRIKITSVVHTFDPQLELHDFRVVDGPTHTNLIFDVVAPFKYRLTDAELITALGNAITAVLPDCRTVIAVDKDYKGSGERTE